VPRAALGQHHAHPCMLLLHRHAQVPKAPEGYAAAEGRVPPGQALVTDSQLPGQRLAFTGKRCGCAGVARVCSRARVCVWPRCAAHAGLLGADPMHVCARLRRRQRPAELRHARDVPRRQQRGQQRDAAGRHGAAGLCVRCRHAQLL
jgi:hypothetical protein